MLKFDNLQKGLGIVSPPHFVYDFSRKMFFMLYSVNWPNFITWLSLLHGILGNMCNLIICFPGSDVINFEINPILKKLWRHCYFFDLWTIWSNPEAGFRTQTLQKLCFHKESPFILQEKKTKKSLTQLSYYCFE